MPGNSDHEAPGRRLPLACQGMQGEIFTWEEMPARKKDKEKSQSSVSGGIC